jgi:PBP1b-binding outer membrane lipoprotein LpoB
MMDKKMRTIITTLALSTSALILGACSSAPKANEVSAAYVPASQYQSMTCEQLITEAESIRRSVPALESAVDKHRSNQTGVEVVTWLLFWPAAFALDKGEATSSQLAKAKGELEAISLAMKSKKCG